MKREKGFTLVELLVVMAIIAILASIVVPNVIGRIRRARATRALAEVTNIDVALTSLLSDIGRSNLTDLFNRTAVDNAITRISNDDDDSLNADFRAATKVYSRVLYAILRGGRSVIDEYDNQLGSNYRSLLDQNIVKKLGNGYMDLAEDPWGSLYNIYPGPFPGRVMIPNSHPRYSIAGRATPLIPFRTYQDMSNNNLPGSGSKRDVLTVEIVDIDTDEEYPVGYAAPKNKAAYVWSNGANLLSSQALYNIYGAQYFQNVDLYDKYDDAQDEVFFGGGDDINNWDSYRSWERFYN